MSEKDEFKPYVPAEKSMPEFTLAAVLVGIFLSVVLCAANVYLGLMAGMTVGASIPAAVISMAILRGIFRRGSILENNMVQTIASAGESIAAGIIFTIPAIVLTGQWTHFEFIPTLLVGIFGGMLGILFMIPLRRALIIEEKELIYPCGVACSEILKTGQKGGAGVKYIFGAVGLGIIYTLLTKFGFLAAKLSGALRIKKMAFGAGAHLSLALLSVGYIIGLNVSVLVFIGGALAWLVAIPIYMGANSGMAIPEGAVDGLAAGANLADFVAHDTYGAAMYVWDNYIRYMGAGAMVVGGLWSIWCMRRGILSSLGEIGKSFKKMGGMTDVKRTEENMPMKYILPLLILIVIGVFLLYWSVLGEAHTAEISKLEQTADKARAELAQEGLDAGKKAELQTNLARAEKELSAEIDRSPIMVAAVAAFAMLIAGFLFVAVSSYIVGLVGSSNNPVSGMTIFTLFLAIILLLAFGIEGGAGMIAALIVAGVVCSAACAAGDMSQDLKTGYLLGATPKKQQIGQIVGVFVAAFVTTPVLILLHEAAKKAGETGIGDKSLPAPQAKMFQGITEALFGGQVPWVMLYAGGGVALAVIILDEILRVKKSSFRFYVMPLAVGIYLPFYMAIPILIGGVIRAIFAKKDSGEADRGILVSSGLIAGEALTGIIIAGIIVITQSESMPNLLSKFLGLFGGEAEQTAGISSIVSQVLGVIVFAGVAAIVASMAKSTKMSTGESCEQTFK